MQKSTINLSINPSYFCNFRCSFCYLSDEQLASRKSLSSEKLFSLLSEVSTHKIISHIDLYGGEIGVLPAELLREYLKIMSLFYQQKINLITNLSAINPVFLDDAFEITVSWDYFARESHEKVFNNMKKLTRDFHVLVLGSEQILQMHDDELLQMIDHLNSLPHLRTVEIKPYSENLYRTHKVTFQDYELFVRKWILLKDRFKFEFINEIKIQESLSGSYSAWSDDHLYLTPNGKFAVLEFTKDNKEFFLEMETFADYEKWASEEKLKVSQNEFCRNCEYLGKCLSEHLQQVREANVCNGFKGLLDWYKTKRDPSS